MYMECKDYYIDSNEKHLGKIGECELIHEKYEIEDLIIQQLFDDETYPSEMKFFFPDEYNDYDIEVNGADFIDVEMVIEYLDSLEEEGLINKDELYALAGVTNPKHRGK